jgi:hypothetical protein
MLSRYWFIFILIGKCEDCFSQYVEASSRQMYAYAWIRKKAFGALPPFVVKPSPWTALLLIPNPHFKNTAASIPRTQRYRNAARWLYPSEISEELQLLHSTVSLDTELVLSFSIEAMPEVKSWGRVLLTSEATSTVTAIAKREAPSVPLTGDVYLVGLDAESDLNRQIKKFFHQDHQINLRFLAFDQLDSSSISPGSRVILSVEEERSMLNQLTPDELKRLCVHQYAAIIRRTGLHLV